MPVKLVYGEDIYLISKRVEQLTKEFTAKEWEIFSYSKIENKLSAIPQAITDARTVSLGEGGKIVHIAEGTIFNKCSDEIVLCLEQNLAKIPNQNLLLVTSTSKPDGRSKAVKILLKYAEVEEFPLIPSWDKQAIEKLIHSSASARSLELTSTVISYLAEAIGNDTARIDSEVTKISTYSNGKKLELEDVQALVSNNNTSCIELAHAIKNGKADTAVLLVHHLLDHNEHPLKIIAFLINCFRTWLITKAGLEAKLPDNKISTLAELTNPKRLYFLKKEVEGASTTKLKQSLVALIQLENELKSGIDNFIPSIIKTCTI
ncbi:DNA polymerase III subunit delta [Calothrix sp. PCC 7716]|nr:DNA polymerase III subunit delta [Calothrix sp. PCC 7716]